MIGKGGFVKGAIKTFDLTNMGKIKGDVTAEHKVNLKEESEIVGDISTYQLIVDEGSNFEGRCKMTKTKPESKEPSKPKKKESIEPLAEIEQISEDIQVAAKQITSESFEIPESRTSQPSNPSSRFSPRFPKMEK